MSEALEILRSRFDVACQEHQIRAALLDRGEGLEVRFEGQEDASPDLMAGAFAQELITARVPRTEWQDPGGLNAEQAGRIADGLAQAIARMRVLLIEHQSYISGGLRWPFDGGDPVFRERGLAIYRFPRMGEVDVYADEDSIHIDVQRADHGEAVSSGFYVPTLVRGDFRVTLDYELGAFEPGPYSVCFALFVQDVPSSIRTYAMRRTSAGRPHELLANFSNRVLTEPIPCANDSEPGGSPSGRFEIRRRGDEMECFHGSRERLVSLGAHRGDPVTDLYFGCKTWTSGLAGPLEARIVDLSIEAQIAQDQIPDPDLRPDPRPERRV